MTDEGAAERVAALRGNRVPEFRHAQAAKILTAGMSTSMVFGIIAYLGHSANEAQAAKDAATQRQLTSEALALQLARPVPTLAPAPTDPAPAVPGRPTSVAPTNATPQVVQVSVPQPAKPAAQPGGGGTPAPANTTKPSG